MGMSSNRDKTIVTSPPPNCEVANGEPPCGDPGKLVANGELDGPPQGNASGCSAGTLHPEVGGMCGGMGCGAKPSGVAASDAPGGTVGGGIARGAGIEFQPPATAGMDLGADCQSLGSMVPGGRSAPAGGIVAGGPAPISGGIEDGAALDEVGGIEAAGPTPNALVNIGNVPSGTGSAAASPGLPVGGRMPAAAQGWPESATWPAGIVSNGEAMDVECASGWTVVSPLTFGCTRRSKR